MASNVVKTFRDSDDEHHLYVKGKDTYPRDGYTPSAERRRSLADGTNKRGWVFIEDDGHTAPNDDDHDEPIQSSDDLQEDAVDKAVAEDAAPMDELTVAQLKSYLDELNAEYKSRDTKDDLIKKLRAALSEE